MAYEPETARRILYDEYHAINTLMHAHLQTHEGGLRALVAFGDLVTRSGTFDIDLLEVVTGWQGQTSVAFTSSAELPLRGQLRLHLLTPEEFEHPENLKRFSKRRLMDRVREGYEVIYEDPPGYARNVLARPAAGSFGDNPLEFLVSGSSGRKP